MNGYLKNHGLGTYEDADWDRITNDHPYWAFVENDPKPGYTGYYRNLYRRLPGTEISELAITWIALHRGGYAWDGQLDTVGGKYLLDRFSTPLYSKPPRITFLNRWCYPAAWWFEPQEGLSLNYSTIIEPSVDLGFDNFDRAADIVYDLRGLVKHAPGKPVINSVEDGEYFSFDSSNFPTHYKVSDDPCGVGEEWQYININEPLIQLPHSLKRQPFYLRTKNTFGQSDVTRYGYDYSDLATLCSNWLGACSGPLWCSEIDTDESGSLNFKDFAVMAEEWLDNTLGFTAHWKLDESTGMIANDDVYNNNGTLVNGPAWQPDGGNIDGALSFDGIDDYVDIDSVIDNINSSQGSIACWIKLDPSVISDSTTHGLIEVGNSSSTDYFIGLRKISDETIRMRYRSGSVNYDATISDISGFDNWHHVAAVWTSTEVKIYLDGSPQDTQTRGSDIADELNIAHIGRKAQGTATAYVAGLFDGIRIYNRALSASEIAALAN